MMQGLQALVLAAGAGTRFGGGKLLAPWRGGVLLDAALSAAFESPADAVTLVSGASARAIEQAARAFAARTGRMERLRIVHARAHAQGMAESLKAGILALPPEAAGTFVFLGDMPRVPPETPRALVSALVPGVLAAAPVFAGRQGNPVLLSRGLFPRLLAQGGDRGARALLAELGPALALVQAPDDGVLFDVDRPGDLALEGA